MLHFSFFYAGQLKKCIFQQFCTEMSLYNCLPCLVSAFTYSPIMTALHGGINIIDLSRLLGPQIVSVRWHSRNAYEKEMLEVQQFRFKFEWEDF